MNNSKVIIVLSLIGLFCVLPSISFTQPSWLREAVKEADRITTHKDAITITLHHTAAVTLQADGLSKTHITCAHKILKPAGENLCMLAELISPFRKIKNLKGWALLPDGKTQTLSKQNIIEVSTPEASNFYDDSHLLLAVLPDLKPGVIAAFEYDIEEDALTSSIQNFIFHTQQPVKFAQFSVTLPNEWRFYQSYWNGNMLLYEQSGNRHIWTARDMPYQPEEPLMPSWKWLATRIVLTFYNPSSSMGTQFINWQAVALWCSDKHREAAMPDETVRTLANEIAQNFSTIEEKLHAIAAFIRDEIRYVAVEIGEGRWQPRPAATTLYNRFGDCKDKTVLMRAMLHALEISSISVLANSDYSVSVNLPTPFQFNHCIIGIPVESQHELSSFKQNCIQGWLFYDPTDPSLNLGDIPPSLQGNLVLLATQADSVLVKLPFQLPQQHRRRYSAIAELQADGSMSAKIRVTDFGNWAIASRYRSKIIPKEKQFEAWKSKLAETVGKTTVINFQTGEYGDSAWVSFQFSGSRYADLMSNLIVLKPDFFHETAESELTAENRQHPIWFGSSKRIETDILWHLPEGWIPETEVNSLESSCDAVSLSCNIVQSDNILRFGSIIIHTGQLLPVEQYAKARKFSQDLSRIKGMSVVLKKK